MRQIRHLLEDDQGATAIEYALIAALITIVAMSAFQFFGTVMSTKFETIAASVSAAS